MNKCGSADFSQKGISWRIMANFVLVHGGWRGGWVWKRVARLLRTAGHDVFTPTLTGLGERSHQLNGGVNLSAHILDIVNLIKFEELNDVILCGHSYGGSVITGVADQLHERISALVYIDAFVPEDGDSILSLLPEAFLLPTVKGVAGNGGYGVPPIPPEEHKVNEQDLEWVKKMCTPHPLAAMTEGIRLHGNHLKVMQRVFALAAAWGPNPFQLFYDKLQHDPAWRVRTIESGHDAALDKPDEVASLLLELAK
jgi:pimeloyl-ACP methyl ester carboxylesterase